MDWDLLSEEQWQKMKDREQERNKEKEQSMPRRVNLFVYGSLKRGGHLSDLLDGQKFLGVTKTCGKYRLVDMGPFPGLIEYALGLCIVGELWSVTWACIKDLDIVENVPTMYRRELVELKDGSKAFGYVLQSSQIKDECIMDDDEWIIGVNDVLARVRIRNSGRQEHKSSQLKLLPPMLPLETIPPGVLEDSDYSGIS